MVDANVSLRHRWWQFIVERFEPISSLTMIAVFVIAHLVVLNFPLLTILGQIPLRVLAVFGGVVFFFFKLRLYDEIKDYELDVVINPTRPLPRGLLLHRHLYLMIGTMIVIELFLFGVWGKAGLFSISLAILYSLFMYKEFFIPKLIRPHLTTYAMTHTIVTVLLGVSIFSSLLGFFPWQLPIYFWWFVFNNWFMFNIFEFGRKTFAQSEEREQVESYSKVFGRFGAVGLVLLQIAASLGCLWMMGDLSTWTLFYSAVLAVVMLLVGLCYALFNRAMLAKVYRLYSSLHIVLFYLGFIIIQCIKG